MAKTRQVYRELPSDINLRGADAIHLAAAVVHGQQTIYSNDARLLDAAKHFGVKGRNIIPLP
jgi:predicted nucleic acid-binding protein